MIGFQVSLRFQVCCGGQVDGGVSVCGETGVPHPTPSRTSTPLYLPQGLSRVWRGRWGLSMGSGVTQIERLTSIPYHLSVNRAVITTTQGVQVIDN